MNKSLYSIFTAFDSTIVAFTEFEKKIHIWDISKKEKLSELDTDFDYGGDRCSLSKDGSYCAVGSFGSNTLEVFDVKEKSIVFRRDDLKKIQKVNFSNLNQDLFVSSEDARTYGLNGETGEILNEYKACKQIFTSPFNSTQLLEKKNLVLVSQHKEWEIKKETFAVLSTAFSEDTVYISEASGKLKAYSSLDGKQIWDFSPKKGNHFIKVWYTVKQKMIFGLSVNYEKGGNKSLFIFDKKDGKLIKENAFEEEFADIGFIQKRNNFITSNGKFYSLNDQFELEIIDAINFQ